MVKQKKRKNKILNVLFNWTVSKNIKHAVRYELFNVTLQGYAAAMQLVQKLDETKWTTLQSKLISWETSPHRGRDNMMIGHSLFYNLLLFPWLIP